jgi:hypothetical protein
MIMSLCLINPFAAYYFLTIFQKLCNFKVKMWAGGGTTKMHFQIPVNVVE